MNYFDLFSMEETFFPEPALVKQRFYELSRTYHPDFYTQNTEDEQLDVLEKSSEVNKGYKVLSNKDETLKYLLQLNGLVEEDEKYQLPPDFLMEVMELNEQLAEARMDEDAGKLQEIKQAINQLQDDIYAPVKNIMEDYRPGITTKETLLPVKQYYFQKKYLSRILAAM